jgi:outer membrane receptor protein involved in Fe transport
VEAWFSVTPQKVSNGARLDLSVNVNNLFDEKEMTVAAYYPEGRTVRFTAGLRF